MDEPNRHRDPGLRSVFVSLTRSKLVQAAKALVHQRRARELPVGPGHCLLIYGRGLPQTAGGLPKEGLSPSSGSNPAGGSAPPAASEWTASAATATITPGGDGTPSSVAEFHNPAEVRVVGSETLKDSAMMSLLSQSPGRSSQDKMPGADLIRRVLQAQKPDRVSHFNVEGGTSHSLLPGGTALLDHIIAWCKVNEGWDRVCKVLESFTTQRVPVLDESQMPEVRELVLGEASVAEHQEIISWLYKKTAETRTKYGMVLPALDVECLSVHVPGRAASWETISEDLLLDDCAWVTIAQPGVTQPLKLPVLLMYGAPGWQVHIRIPVEYWREGNTMQVKIKGGAVNVRMLERVFGLFMPAVGTGIGDDVSSFIQAVEKIYDVVLNKDRIPVGIPLSMISMLAGVSHRQSSVFFMVYLVLGGVLAKDWRCSVGDYRWGDPYSSLHPALKAYLCGDIQQVSIAATVLVIIWVAHLLPSADLIRTESGLNPCELVNIWIKTAVQRDLARLATGRDHTVPGTAKNRKDLIRSLGASPESQDALLTLSPEWPAITSGGPRSSESTIAFSKKTLNLFRSLHGDSLPERPSIVEISQPLGLSPVPVETMARLSPAQQMEVDDAPEPQGQGQPNDVGRREARPAPETSARAQAVDSAPPNQDMVGTIQRPPALRNSLDPIFDLRPESLTLAVLKGSCNALKVPKRPILAEYIARDIDRAVVLLDLLEADRIASVKALSYKYANKVVKDLRLFLKAQGRLRRRSPTWTDPWEHDIHEREAKKRQENRLNVMSQQVINKTGRTLARGQSAVIREAAAVNLPAPRLLVSIPPPREVRFPGHGAGISKRARQRRNKRLKRAAEAARIAALNGAQEVPQVAAIPMELMADEPAAALSGPVTPPSGGVQAGTGEEREPELGDQLSSLLEPAGHVIEDEEMLELQAPRVITPSNPRISLADYKNRRLQKKIVITVEREPPTTPPRPQDAAPPEPAPMLETPPPYYSPSAATARDDQTPERLVRMVNEEKTTPPKPSSSKASPKDKRASPPKATPKDKKAATSKASPKKKVMTLKDFVPKNQTMTDTLTKAITNRFAKGNDPKEDVFVNKVGRATLQLAIQEMKDGISFRAPFKGTGWWIYWVGQERLFVRHPTGKLKVRVKEEPPTELKNHPDFIRAIFSSRSAKDIKGRVPILNAVTGEENASEDESSSSSDSDSDSDSDSSSSSDCDSDLDSDSGPTGVTGGKGARKE